MHVQPTLFPPAPAASSILSCGQTLTSVSDDRQLRKRGGSRSLRGCDHPAIQHHQREASSPGSFRERAPAGRPQPPPVAGVETQGGALGAGYGRAAPRAPIHGPVQREPVAEDPHRGGTPRGRAPDPPHPQRDDPPGAQRPTSANAATNLGDGHRGIRLAQKKRDANVAGIAPFVETGPVPPAGPAPARAPLHAPPETGARGRQRLARNQEAGAVSRAVRGVVEPAAGLKVGGMPSQKGNCRARGWRLQGNMGLYTVVVRFLALVAWRIVEIFCTFTPKLAGCLKRIVWRPSLAAQLRARLDYSSCYSEYADLAVELDRTLGNDLWRANPRSRLYDYKLISQLSLRIHQLRSQGRFAELKEVIRSGLVRNVGSIGALPLYERAYAGTKLLIESYLESVLLSLRALAAPGKPAQMQFFANAKQSYGQTALILHGGSVFGLCHLGVVKALLEAHLLPDVVCGAAAGSIIAAYVCSVPPDLILAAISSAALNSNDCACDKSSPQLPPSLLAFYKLTFKHLGSMTFAEAFAISGRSLNVLVREKGKPAGVFYNHLTTPQVVIMGAVEASLGFGETCLYAKDWEGRVVEQCRKRFVAASGAVGVPARASPYTRLAELFNVNNYVVSIARPYFAPFLRTDTRLRGKARLWRRLLRLACVTISCRASQLAEFGALPLWARALFVDETIPHQFFQINVVPATNQIMKDFRSALSQPANLQALIEHLVLLGERGVWPNLPIISTRTRIERTLADICRS